MRKAVPCCSNTAILAQHLHGPCDSCLREHLPCGPSLQSTSRACAVMTSRPAMCRTTSCETLREAGERRETARRTGGLRAWCSPRAVCRAITETASQAYKPILPFQERDEGAHDLVATSPPLLPPLCPSRRYMGMLASEGSYDRCEAMLASESRQRAARCFEAAAAAWVAASAVQ